MTTTTSTTATTTTIDPVPTFQLDFKTSDAFQQGYANLVDILKQLCLTENDLFDAIKQDRIRLKDNEGTVRALGQQQAINMTVWPAQLHLWLDTDQLNGCNNTDLFDSAGGPVISSAVGMTTAWAAVLFVMVQALMRV
jgi:hypothetical protein